MTTPGTPSPQPAGAGDNGPASTDASGHPVPDTKDWTWTAARPCPECGTDATDMSPHDVAAALRSSIARWQSALAADNAGQRPSPGTWSPLEYAAHVRDVFRVMHYRLDLMLTRDEPGFPDWDQDETAVEDHYAQQDPGVVATQLAAAGRGLADAFDAVLDRDLERVGYRSNGATFTVQTLGRYTWHDVAHHLHDVGA